LKGQYSVIITVASPITDCMEPQLLSRFADQVVFVVRSKKTKASRLRAAVARMEAAGSAVSGAILTGMQRIYMSKE
jgi:Mrp family chromosome partitioning ATPase